jgi:hypothetical protein
MREATGVTAGSKLVSFGRGCKLGGGDSIGDSRSAQASGRVAAGIMGGTEADRIARAGLYGKVSGKSQILIFESDLLFNSHSHCSPFAALNWLQVNVGNLRVVDGFFIDAVVGLTNLYSSSQNLAAKDILRRPYGMANGTLWLLW